MFDLLKSGDLEHYFLQFLTVASFKVFVLIAFDSFMETSVSPALQEESYLCDSDVCVVHLLCFMAAFAPVGSL